MAMLGCRLPRPVSILLTAAVVVPLALAAGRPDRGFAQGNPSPPLLIQGRMSLAPDHGPVGPTFTINTVGLQPDVPLNVVWTDVDGLWRLGEDNTTYLGRAFTPHDTVLTTITPDDNGTVSVQVTAPAGFGDEHDVLLQRADGVIVNKAAFNIDMEVTVSPTSGPVGTPITIEAHGIGFRAGNDSWQISYDSAYTGWVSAVTTHGNAKAVIPATGALGVHTIAVMHGEFTFPYLNPQQNPYTGRPQWHIPFTVTADEPVLPPDSSTQTLTPDPVKPPAAGTLTLTPPAGVVGSSALVMAFGMPANAEFAVLWSSVRGNRVSGQGFAGTDDQIGIAHTDAQGTLSWRFSVPDDLGGPHTLSLLNGDQMAAHGEYTITPSAFPISQSSGPSGTRVLIHLKGVGWTETANIYHVDVDNAYAGYACGFNSDGDVQLYLDMDGALGWHFIDLYPGIYKGKEDSPNNFRTPQLTFATDHPGERLPAFHFAFQITAPR
jgi:hypothetical protein